MGSGVTNIIKTGLPPAEGLQLAASGTPGACSVLLAPTSEGCASGRAIRLTGWLLTPVSAER